MEILNVKYWEDFYLCMHEYDYFIINDKHLLFLKDYSDVFDFRASFIEREWENRL